MSIEKQVELLNELVQVMHNCAAEGYEEMTCLFRINNPDGSWSIDTEFSFVRNGEDVSAFLRDPKNRMILNVRELHSLMKTQTGGSWNAFELSVGPGGKAKTRFIY